MRASSRCASRRCRCYCRSALTRGPQPALYAGEAEIDGGTNAGSTAAATASAEHVAVRTHTTSVSSSLDIAPAFTHSVAPPSMAASAARLRASAASQQREADAGETRALFFAPRSPPARRNVVAAAAAAAATAATFATFAGSLGPVVESTEPLAQSQPHRLAATTDSADASTGAGAGGWLARQEADAARRGSDAGASGGGREESPQYDSDFED